ncbi:MAG TPA: RNA polymerase sigma factor [Terriglobales bacterium]|nr:RNA polymerase sigma factor [Terriglobales bacterium]
MINVAEDRNAAPPATASALALARPEDFRQLVDAYSARLFRMAYRMTGQTQDAEDLVQETFLRAYRHRDRFEARSNLGTWLYRICVNASLDHLRQRRSGERSLDDPNPASAAEPVVSPAAGPERLTLSGELARQVQAAMADLTPVERAAFAMRHYENLSIAEIGAALGLRDAAAKNTIFRGVRKLRRALAPLREATR